MTMNYSLDAKTITTQQIIEDVLDDSSKGITLFTAMCRPYCLHYQVAYMAYYLEYNESAVPKKQ